MKFYLNFAEKIKYFVLLLASCMSMVACTGKSASSSGPTVTEDSTSIEVDISKLQDDSGELYASVNTQVDLGLANPTIPVLRKNVILKNNGSSSLMLSFDSIDPSIGLGIKINRCTNELKPGWSCNIYLGLSARNIYDGPFGSNLIVRSGSKQLTIPVVATIEGQPDPSALDSSLSFTFGGFNSGSGFKRDLIVSNAGPGNASAIVITPPSGYAIWTNRCSSTLKSNQSCTVTLYNINTRSGQQSSGLIQISAASHSGAISVAPISILAGGSSSSNSGNGGSGGGGNDDPQLVCSNGDGDWDGISCSYARHNCESSGSTWDYDNLVCNNDGGGNICDTMPDDPTCNNGGGNDPGMQCSMSGGLWTGSSCITDPEQMCLYGNATAIYSNNMCYSNNHDYQCAQDHQSYQDCDGYISSDFSISSATAILTTYGGNTVAIDAYYSGQQTPQGVHVYNGFNCLNEMGPYTLIQYGGSRGHFEISGGLGDNLSIKLSPTPSDSPTSLSTCFNLTVENHAPEIEESSGTSTYPENVMDLKIHTHLTDTTIVQSIILYYDGNCQGQIEEISNLNIMSMPQVDSTYYEISTIIDPSPYSINSNYWLKVKAPNGSMSNDCYQGYTTQSRN